MESTLKKLRIKFVAIIMVAVTVVLAGTFITIVVINHNNSVNEVYKALDMAIERDTVQVYQGINSFPEDGGNVPPALSGNPNAGWQNRGSNGMRRFEIGGHTENQSLIPVAVYKLGDNGKLTALSSEASSFMSDSVLNDVAKYVSARQDDRGFIDSVGVFFVKTKVESSTYVAVADEGSASEWKRLALILAGVGLIALLVFFVVSLVFSRWALRPVAKAWERQQQFVADASHELKTPLTVLSANVSIISRHPSETVASQSRWIESMDAEISSMQELVGDMLTLAREDEGAPQLVAESFQRVDLSKLAGRQVLQFESLAFENGITETDDIADGVNVMGEAEKLKRLIGTLLDNAYKYAGEGGMVNVSLVQDGGNAVLAVTNSGEPISAEDLPHVFDRFYRADKARGRDGSHSFGLGLAIASEIARSHGGTLQVASTAETGTTFTLSLPVAD